MFAAHSNIYNMFVQESQKEKDSEHMSTAFRNYGDLAQDLHHTYLLLGGKKEHCANIWQCI